MQPLGSTTVDMLYGKRRNALEVEAGYSLKGDVSDGAQFGFRVGAYDPQKVLVLDPVILLYAGYIGGSGGVGLDIGEGIAVDSAGNAYVAGFTASDEATFPVTVGPDLTFKGGSGFGYDAFVAKVNPSGTALVYAGYIGGSGDDYGTGIAVDSTGNAYVTGYTFSTEATFPVTVGPDLTFNGDVSTFNNDAFVVKVNPSGTALIYAGYIGGSDGDGGFGIAVDSTSNAYVTGITFSTEATFPVTVGPDLTFNASACCGDAFVAKVNPSGTALDYAGYIGGLGHDFGTGIAVDSTGNAYVTGHTFSTEATFPVTVGPDLTYNGDGIEVGDAFVAKVNPLGTALDYAGYIGGSDGDAGEGIAVDSTGNAYVAGHTFSTEATFPVTVGPDLTYNGGGLRFGDAFVAKVNPSGTALVYAGYIGGSSNDQGRGIAVDSTGNAYVTGRTTSTEATFPVTQGPDLTYSDGFDAFVAKVNTSGTALIYAGYIGSPVTDNGRGIAVDSTGNAYVIGDTRSTEASFPVTVGPDLTFNGERDAFVAKIGVGPSISSISPSSSVPGTVGFTLTVNGSDFVAGSVVRWDGEDRVTTFLGDTVLEASIPASDIAVAGTAAVTVINPPPGGGISASVTFSINFPPAINPGGVVNGASFGNLPMTGGSIGSIFGVNLAVSTLVADSVPLPTSLGGVSVLIDGVAAPLFFVSPSQINFQFPWESLGQTEVSITVTVNGVPSPQQTISVAAFNPGIFVIDVALPGQGAILIAATGEIAAPSGSVPGRATRPADRGEFLSIFSSGLGAVTNQPANGEAALADPLSITTMAPSVTIGDVSAPVSFSGLAPGFAGLYQVNVQVPENVPGSQAVEVVLTIGGVASNTVTIAVQ